MMALRTVNVSKGPIIISRLWILASIGVFFLNEWALYFLYRNFTVNYDYIHSNESSYAVFSENFWSKRPTSSEINQIRIHTERQMSE